jgi:hypothetical protein
MSLKAVARQFCEQEQFLGEWLLIDPKILLPQPLAGRARSKVRA